LAFTIDWTTAPPTITVPQSDLSVVSGTLYEHDTDAFWDEIKALEASEEGIVFDDLQTRAPAVTVAGTTFAPFFTITGRSQLQYEDTASFYTVRLAGTNNDIWDEGGGAYLPHANVMVSPTNSAGLQLVSTGVSGLTAAESADLAIVRKEATNRRELINVGTTQNPDWRWRTFDDDDTSVVDDLDHEVQDIDGNQIQPVAGSVAKRSKGGDPLP